MNTSAGYYQAPRPPRVPLDEVLIKLHPEGYHQAFEADAINVGAGGISMRASVLPQIGSTLRCQLDNPVGGEAIEMIGRVVWAHESGEHAGEFGIRFTHLSNDDQTRIEALIQRWGRTSATAPTVTLHLDGVDSAIVAELQSETDTVLTVEQPLPFLAIGSGMVNASAGRRGHLEAVELRMDAETPKLVLSIAYEVLGEREADAIEEAGRDTMPDEPPVIRASRPSGEVRMHDTPRVIRYDRSEEDAARESIGDRLRTYGKSAIDQLATTAGSARSAVTEVFVPRAGAAIRDFFALISRFVGALRARLD
ncbi:MAG: PilZ domain-containing protein, partial [Polyangiales bacterium]